MLFQPQPWQLSTHNIKHCEGDEYLYGVCPKNIKLYDSLSIAVVVVPFKGLD